MKNEQPNTHDDRLIDYALHALNSKQRAEVEAELENNSDARETVDDLRRLTQHLKQSAISTSISPSAELRKSIDLHLDESEKPVAAESQRRWRVWPQSQMSRVALLLAILILPIPAFLIAFSFITNAREEARRAQVVNDLKQMGIAMHNYQDVYKQLPGGHRGTNLMTLLLSSRVEPSGTKDILIDGNRVELFTGEIRQNEDSEYGTTVSREGITSLGFVRGNQANRAVVVVSDGNIGLVASEGRIIRATDGKPRVTWDIDNDGDGIPETVWVSGLALSADGRSLVRGEGEVNVQLWNGQTMLMVKPRILITQEEEEVLVIDGFGEALDRASRESYEKITENPFVPVKGQQALSTFSIDVDTASYSNVRRFLTGGQLPPADAVRIEELINYFHYDYPQPQSGEPFSVTMEVAECPWQSDHKLVRIGLKGREISRENRPASNLVFLIDVSGSMADQNKLPLLKESMKLLVSQLDERDRVSIVTYAGDAGLQLKPTAGDKQLKIRKVIDGLKSGGSTHGSAGIQLAYQQAINSFIDDGTNRVILATDGDLNVGITNDEELVELIKEKAQSSVFLTVLGFGGGNYQDAKLEKLADHGNGVFAYIDNLREGRKVLVEQIAGSLVTIAKDVKIQVEFNPAEVASYRLIGYENRVMAAKDFDDDKKDAGEIGAGHTVTALYEIVPASHTEVSKRNGHSEQSKQDIGEQAKELKYQQAEKVEEDLRVTAAAKSGELLTVWLRYKKPDSDTSKRIDFTLAKSNTRFNRASQDFQFAAAVASFGMLLRDSKHAGNSTLTAVEEIASSSIGDDPGGYRTEFLDLVRRAETIKR